MQHTRPPYGTGDISTLLALLQLSMSCLDSNDLLFLKSQGIKETILDRPVIKLAPLTFLIETDHICEDGGMTP